MFRWMSRMKRDDKIRNVRGSLGVESIGDKMREKIEMV